jgi:hypothetical protein
MAVTYRILSSGMSGHPEDGGCMLLQKVGKLIPGYMVSSQNAVFFIPTTCVSPIIQLSLLMN